MRKIDTVADRALPGRYSIKQSAQAEIAPTLTGSYALRGGRPSLSKGIEMENTNTTSTQQPVAESSRNAAGQLKKSLQDLMSYIERDLENNSPEWSAHDVPEYVKAKAMLQGWPDPDTEETNTIAVDPAILATLVSCAQAHIEDIETGIEEGLYVEAENADLQSKKDAVEAVSLLLQPHAQLLRGEPPQELTQDACGPGAPMECPPGGYFIMYGYEKTADHCGTLTDARKRGQELCDEDPLPGTWSIHDANGDFVEDIKRSDGKTLEDQIKVFGLDC